MESYFVVPSCAAPAVCRIVRYSVIAQRWYYVNSARGQELWCMPDEVKYYTTAAEWDRVS